MAERLERHPLSAIWGDMPEGEYRQFVESIRDTKETYNKFIIWTYEGKVLDGWHRYKACEELGIPAPTLPYNGQDPAGFVIRANGLRRHLTPGQRADAIVSCVKWRERGRPKTVSNDTDSGPDDVPQEMGRTEMAAAVGISEPTISRARARARAAEEPEGSDELAEPRPPTKAERLEAERDALALDVQEKAGRIDEMEDELQFHRGNMSGQEHERHKAFTAVRAELSTALSQNNEWMTKANDEVQARKGMTYDRDRWRERAMHPCANCGTEAEWADG